MNNRISKYFNNGKKEHENIQDTRTFFLACEYKPNSTFWSVLDPFAYDIKPAFIHGSLGVIAYEPTASYSIVEEGLECQPLLGYIVTITNPEAILLLDRAKGYYGYDSFNMHVRKLVKAYTDIDEEINVWCYLLSNNVLNAYQSLEICEFGIWDNDEKQMMLLERIIDKE